VLAAGALSLLLPRGVRQPARIATTPSP
jgi:hypothetical protein